MNMNPTQFQINQSVNANDSSQPMHGRTRRRILDRNAENVQSLNQFNQPTQLIYALSADEDIRQHLNDTFTGLHNQQIELFNNSTNSGSNHEPNDHTDRQSQHQSNEQSEIELIDEGTIRCAFIFVLGYPPSRYELERLSESYNQSNNQRMLPVKQSGKLNQFPNSRNIQSNAQSNIQSDKSSNNQSNNHNEPGQLTMCRSQFIDYFTLRIKQSSPQSFIQSIYQSFDRFNQGFIRRAEFYDIMKEVHQSINRSNNLSDNHSNDQSVYFTDSMIQSLFDMADVDRDDVISYREFEAVMSGRILNHY